MKQDWWRLLLVAAMFILLIWLLDKGLAP